MTMRGVLFDLGNTVLEYSLTGRWREFRLERLAQLYPVVYQMMRPTTDSAADFAERVGEVIGGELARAIEHSGRSWQFRDRLGQGLAAVGVKADADHIERLTDLFYQPIHDCNRPYPDTTDVLSRLRSAGLRLAVITNAPWDTPGRLLRGDLDQWHCADFFDAFICSGDVPWRKPNPRFMLAAAEELGVPPDACVVVGDSLEADIAGASAAGMRSVWMNPSGAAPPPGGPRPDWTAQSLTAIAELLNIEERA
jgi:HAD superfamily hydrolase (TIGR01509 family)